MIPLTQNGSQRNERTDSRSSRRKPLKESAIRFLSLLFAQVIILSNRGKTAGSSPGSPKSTVETPSRSMTTPKNRVHSRTPGSRSRKFGSNRKRRVSGVLLNYARKKQCGRSPPPPSHWSHHNGRSIFPFFHVLHLLGNKRNGTPID